MVQYTMALGCVCYQNNKRRSTVDIMAGNVAPSVLLLESKAAQNSVQSLDTVHCAEHGYRVRTK